MYAARAKIIFLLFVTVFAARAECAESAESVRGGLSASGGVIGIRRHYTEAAFGLTGFGYFHKHWGMEVIALVSASFLLSLDIVYRHSLFRSEKVYITLGTGVSLDIDERIGYGPNLKTGMEFLPAIPEFFGAEPGGRAALFFYNAQHSGTQPSDIVIAVCFYISAKPMVLYPRCRLVYMPARTGTLLST